VSGLDGLRRVKQSVVAVLNPRPHTLRYRAGVAWRYVRRPLAEVAPWLRGSREFTNFTYDLSPRNVAYLTAMVALVADRPHEEIAAYVRELQEDRDVASHVARIARRLSRDVGIDPVPRFGRRLAWYALVRALKPRVVVETGVDKGLGTLALAAALLRNAGEGSPGRVIATDIAPKAGVLLQGQYLEVGEIRIGDSIKTLETLAEPIDVFVSDSDHSETYEAREYATVRERLKPTSVLVADNAHCTTKLLEFALESRRRFLFFREEPEHHWYPGGGAGFAF